MSKIRIVLLTNKSLHGLEILKNLRKKKIPLEAIIIEDPKTYQKIKNAWKIIRKKGVIVIVKLVLKKIFSEGKKYSSLTIQNESYRRFSPNIRIVENFNSFDCAIILLRIKPDILILGGTRIIKDYILAIPRIGTLNVHPGLLPKYQGVDVIPWAIYNNDEVGITVHFVDEGIDTGKIISQAKIVINPGDNLQSISQKAMIMGGIKITEVVEKIYHNRQIKAKNQNSKGVLYYQMPNKLIKIVERKLAQWPKR